MIIESKEREVLLMYSVMLKFNGINEILEGMPYATEKEAQEKIDIFRVNYPTFEEENNLEIYIKRVDN